MKKTIVSEAKTITAKKSNVTIVTTKTEKVEQVKPRRYVKRNAAYWNSKSTHKHEKISGVTPADHDAVMSKIKMSNESYLTKHFDIVQLLLKNDLKVSRVYRLTMKSTATIHKVKCAILKQQENFS